jgi:eukaryotic-like serine/threonine-protein kinase
MEGDEASGWRPGKPFTFARGSPAVSDPAFSPDGRWIAYVSAEASGPNIFVQPFPGPGGKRQISSAGGTHPAWSRTRPELFFQSADQRINIASYSIEGDSFNADKPRRWSDAQLLIRPRGTAGVAGRAFDLHPDGVRIGGGVAPSEPSNAKLDHVTLIFNFSEELKRIAPGRR